MTARALNIPHAKGQAAKKAPSPVAKAVKGALSWDLSKSITPLKDVGQLFVRTLALVFHQAGLLPRNYPGIFNDGRPRFMAVVGDAYRNIVWARENTLQILFFFSVVGFMFCTLMVAGLTAAGFVFGSAHAQSNGGFFVNQNDMGRHILDYIFLADKTTLNAIAPARFGEMEGVIEGIRHMFGFYSKAMLVFAAVILLYLLVGMIAETAHEGVTLGKRANQIWAPVRLVVAIGLLVPVGDTLSSGQAVVIQTARWGSQLASNVWEKFIEKYSMTSEVN
ncbi:MAG: hypothetical protein EBZ69_09145, partial [Alphaproteobacteria bacterium]|nr:hypothetical protein [Alphaproteobacteria bacterium]